VLSLFDLLEHCVHIQVEPYICLSSEIEDVIATTRSRLYLHFWLKRSEKMELMLSKTPTADSRRRTPNRVHGIDVYLYTTSYRLNDRLPSAELRLRSATVPLQDNSRPKIANWGNLINPKQANRARCTRATPSNAFA
jgi:hypothetical protein